MTPTISYQPSAYFYRQLIAEAKSRTEAAEIAFQLVLELELHRAWVRDQGLVPPKFFVTQAEHAAKAAPPAEVCPFPSTAPASATGA